MIRNQVNVAAKMRVRAKLQSGEISSIKAGYWFCLECQHITKRLPVSSGACVCIICRSPRISWNRPIEEQLKIQL